jgi:hypothetical protein
MNYPTAIVVGAALVAGAIALDKLPTPAFAQVPSEGFSFRPQNLVAGEKLWWVESRVQANRVYMCNDIGDGVRCRYQDVPK